MTYKTTCKSLKKKLEISESMVASAVWELQFANLQTEHLLTTCDEMLKWYKYKAINNK